MHPKANLRLEICATDGVPGSESACQDYGFKTDKRVIIQISLGRFLYIRSCKKPQRVLFVFKSASHSGFVLYCTSFLYETGEVCKQILEFVINPYQ